MKLRIKGNSIRLRLSKPEVEKLAVANYLEERTPFGNNSFRYALQTTDAAEISADFDGSKITVFIPEIFIKDWAVNDVVGFNAAMHVSDTESIFILVEKDFKCLDEATEDQSNNYENPNKTC
ncbi:DUF7009 family protein [Pollutibacter soli]|uniref:DUF7009 family protein n=1 Tax=Pollutibacter soli TaxID=3034157 RepID=UPI003013A4FB